MQHLGKWAAGIVGGVLALGVLFYAANATSAGTYNSALFLFVILIVFVFAQIKRGFDQADRARADDGNTGPAAGDGDSGKSSGVRKGSGQTAATGRASATGAGSTSTAPKNGGATNGGANQGGRESPAGPAQSAAASGAAKSGLSESAPSGPTNGTGAKH